MLNPGRPVACQSCGKKIGISLLHTVRAMLFFVPVVVVVHAVFEGSVLLTTLVCLGIGLALTPLFFHFVPLERR
jgi:hypothetical protein